jgi:hypothetical protein
MKIIEKNNFGFMETSTFDFFDKNLTHSSNKVKDKSGTKRQLWSRGNAIKREKGTACCPLY